MVVCSIHYLVLADLVSPVSLNQHSHSTIMKTHALKLQRCLTSKALPLWHLHVPRGILNTRLAKTHLRPNSGGLWRHLAPWFSLSTAPIYPCTKSCPLQERLRAYFLPKPVFSPQSHVGQIKAARHRALGKD